MTLVKESSGKRISEIELMRFVAALAIVAYHFKFVVGRGYIFVEFFFILTGLLMAQSAHKSLEKSDTISIGNNTKTFMIRKIKPLLPFLILSYIMMIVAYTLKSDSILSIDMVFNQIPNYLLLMDGGFTVESPIMPDVTWYISAMIIGLLILYPLYLYCKKNTAWIAMLLIFILSIGYVINNSNNLDLYRQWGGWICLGLLRGIGEMALGAFCFELCLNLKRINFSTIGKIIFTAIILLLIAILILWSIGEFEGTKDFIMIFIIAALISMIYSEKGYSIPRGNKVCQYLGTLSLPMYLFHRPVERTIRNTLGGDWFSSNVVISIIAVILLSIIMVSIVRYLEKRSVTEKMMSIFVIRQK